MLYEVIVKKIVEQAILVEANSTHEACYKGSCQASDSDYVEVLETTATECKEGRIVA